MEKVTGPRILIVYKPSVDVKPLKNFLQEYTHELRVLTAVESEAFNLLFSAKPFDLIVLCDVTPKVFMRMSVVFSYNIYNEYPKPFVLQIGKIWKKEKWKGLIKEHHKKIEQWNAKKFFQELQTT